MAVIGQQKRANSLLTGLATRPYILAIAIALLLSLWLFSGMLGQEQKSAPTIRTNAPVANVTVKTFYAEPIEHTVTLYGRTEPDRQVILQAQVAGEITEVFAQRGQYVRKGDVIAKIALNDLPAQLEHYQTLLKQRRVDYYGAKALFSGGLENESALAKRLADVTEAKADLARIELAIENTTIVAPFDGVLNERFVEVGDYVSPSEDIAMLADLDPLIIRAHLSEQQVGTMELNQRARVTLLNQQQASGQIRYIASVANEQTNTFKVEIAIDNGNQQYLAGMSSEVELSKRQVSAIKVSPALLALDANGSIGIKSVADERVVFTPAQIVKSDEDGIWLAGLADEMRIITLGQGFVRAGDKVSVVEVLD
ncbi:efflux RND transporter periplasmic adaptor subunit [Thalassotalea ponticola]|uniref:efflux RND transporter periplasmic adaptor subunit n=1 Tax=Thalassotalea ponticola TaxID=1523392 RepID=UPI0025B318E3|nr:efflux RND transporter periplasmic adaptor subunit [Thalassotalea ponticola]MDN3653483.1 efflux RND transporter periplasmic adaptor subunit [Thalassotalea ponticola]